MSDKREIYEIIGQVLRRREAEGWRDFLSDGTAEEIAKAIAAWLASKGSRS